QMGLRIILGLIYFVFGLNGFLGFISMPPLPEAAMGFMGGMFSAPYFIWILKPTEIIGGFLLLLGKAVPFALVILAPITVNIFLFHLFLAGSPGMAIGMFIIHVALIKMNWNAYKPMFK